MSIELKDLGVIGLIIGVATSCYTLYQNYKNKQELKETTDKLNLTIDDVSRNTKVDIEQRIVDKAIERAVEREVHRATIDAVAAVKADVHDTISKNVKKEVDAQYKTLTEEVTEKISDQVAAISEDALVNKVIPRVEAKLQKLGEEKINQSVIEARSKAGSALAQVLNVYNDVSTITGKFMDNSTGNATNRTAQFRY